jgi:alpha-mannosidase
MWLEADCNLTSGESLVRQILHGTRYFREQFGVENKIVWLPDVFGYSAALPQIMKLAGVKYFMTTKINWNQYNPIPADSFLWEGIDGSQILTHSSRPHRSTTTRRLISAPTTSTSNPAVMASGNSTRTSRTTTRSWFPTAMATAAATD